MRILNESSNIPKYYNKNHLVERSWVTFIVSQFERIIGIESIQRYKQTKLIIFS